MAQNIKNTEDNRSQRLRQPSTADRRRRVLRFLEKRVWPSLPKDQVGRRLSRADEDDILGYGRAE